MPKLTRDERIKRVALLCCHCTRNLAYFRAGWTELKPRKEGDFWITAIGNFIDVAVLEWCKLFGDDVDKHHWKNIATDEALFRSELKRTLEISDAEWKETWKNIRSYRDKFIAHLDSERIMNVPDMGLPQQMVAFYFNQLKVLCLDEQLLAGMPSQMNDYYLDCYEEAVNVYRHYKHLKASTDAVNAT